MEDSDHTVTIVASQTRALAGVLIIPLSVGMLYRSINIAVETGHRIHPNANSAGLYLMFAALALIMAGLWIYGLSSLMHPPTLKISKDGLTFQSIWRRYSINWRDYGFARVEVRPSRYTSTHYAVFPAIAARKDAELVIDGYRRDHDDVFRCIISAQSGRVINAGADSAPKDVIVLIVLMVCGYIWLGVRSVENFFN